MATPLHVLLIEDSEDDAALLVREIRRGGYEPVWERVDTAAALTAALARPGWDVITCDYVMPQFSAPAALEIIRTHAVDVPVIIVSGEVGEEAAATAMRAGAHDYISKFRLTRLVPAIERELREAEHRRARTQAETALRESEARFSNAFIYAPVGMALVGIDGQVLRVNRALCQMFGYSEQELLEMPVWMITHPDDMPVTIESLQRLLEGTQDTWHLEKRFLHRNGTVVWGVSSTSLVRDGSGQPLYLISQVLDVTERRRAEEALRESRANLQAILNNSLQSFVLTDRHGTIKAFNQIASVRTELFFSHRSLVEGESIFNHVPIGYAAEFARDFGRAQGGAIVVADVPSRDRTGGEHWFEFNYIPVCDGGSVVTGVCLSVLDTTERRRAARAVRDSEKRLRTYIDQASDLIFTLDAAGRIASMNRAASELTGYSADALVGRSPLDLLVPENAAAAQAALARVLAGADVDQAEVQIFTKSGRRIWLEVRGRSLYEGDRLVETFHIARDITARKEAELARARLRERRTGT